MALSRYVERKFGMKTRSIPNPVTDTCLTEITRLLRDNPDRISYLLVNLGGSDIHVVFDEKPSTTRGIFVANGGGILSLTADDDGELVGYPLFGIATGADSEVFVLETEGE